MSERLPRHEGVSTFSAFSGSTVENFVQCAFKGENGLIIFDKDREPRHYFKSIFFAPHMITAVRIAIKRAKELRHIPLVFAGRIPEQYNDGYELPEGMTFPVVQVWIPKEEVDWKTMNAYSFNRDEVINSFALIDPQSLLKEESGK